MSDKEIIDEPPTEEVLDPESDSPQGPQDMMEVTEAPPMAQMPTQVQEIFARELAKALVEKKTTESTQIIDLEALPIDIMGVVPQYGRWFWYKGWKRDPTDRSRIVYDLYVCPEKISKIIAKSLEMIDTRWGPERAKVFVMWTVAKGRTYDPTNKRVVPIRQVMMTPLMARRGADVSKLLDKLTPDVIKKSIQVVKKHEGLLYAEMAQMKTAEAETAWTVVGQKAESHFKSTERMLRLAGEATDKGDEEFAKSFTENKDWKDKLADNWCILLIFALVVIYIIGYGLGWWVIT
jgi:hypothetical protein